MKVFTPELRNYKKVVIYEIEPAVWGRVGQDPRVQPRVDPGLHRKFSKMSNSRNFHVAKISCYTVFPATILRVLE